VAPSPLAPGEVITLSLCGSTTDSSRGPCENTTNEIQMSVTVSAGSTCPCFSWSLLNLSLTDLGTPYAGYGIMDLRPGTYQVTAQINNILGIFKFFHNSSTSAIGVVPSSIQSLSGPPATNVNCQLEYKPNSSELPANVSFQFTVADGSSGGTC
jgi:hypothetical protein